MNCENHIVLPPFLDTYIYDKLGADFAPDFAKFNRNLNHEKSDVLIYLGTYFPRSFAESYSIFNNVFKNVMVKGKIETKNELNILDIGSGTGGNLSGLLLSIIENFSNDINFNIVAIDGNNEALKILEKIVFQFIDKFNINISLKCHYVTFDDVKDLYEKSKNYIANNFEFIISSKMINEIINHDRNSYYDYYDYYAQYLSSDGLLLLLDVTTKIPPLDFLPILLNQQTNEFIQKNCKIYKTLIPTCCSENDINCRHECFSNNIFFVSHKKRQEDKSKVAYRILGNKEFVQEILVKVQNKGGIIGWESDNSPKYCLFSAIEERLQNAYKV